MPSSLLFLIVALIVLPFGYLFLCRWMKQKVPNPPRWAFFFVFGTVGGFCLCRALMAAENSLLAFLALFVAVLFFPAAFVTLLISAIRCLSAKARTRLHHAAAAASAVLLLLIIWGATTPDLLGMTYAGTWDDDKENWSRAMGGMPIPPRVEVIHSRYVRSPHFTYEAYYYLELRAPEKFLLDWIAFQKLEESDPKSATDLDSFDDRPSWFVPGPLTDYDFWRPAGHPEYDRFKLFRNKQTGVLFVADRQGM